jgi:plastocyanin
MTVVLSRRRWLHLAAAAAIALGLTQGLQAAPVAAAGHGWQLTPPRHGVSPHRGGASPRATGGNEVVTADWANPAGHNWEFTDFFPRSGTSVHQGDVVDFHVHDGASPDVTHTATLLKSGQTPAQAWNQFPQYLPDDDDGGGLATQQQNVQLFVSGGIPATGPAPPCGGDPTTPCTYDGSQDINSGQLSSSGFGGAPTTDFFATVNMPAGTTVTFVCLLHAGMSGSLTVVDGATPTTTPAQAAGLSAPQAQADFNEASATEQARQAAGSSPNPNGSTHWTVSAAAATPSLHVAINEMIPSVLAVKPGDTVTWQTGTTQENHTVSFPLDNAVGSVLPFGPFACEGASGDTIAPDQNNPPFGCTSNPPDAQSGLPFEATFNTAPQGPPAIASGATAASSGIIGDSSGLYSPPPPYPTSHTFGFPAKGAFTYVCAIHFHMRGTVLTSGYYEVASDGGVFTQGNLDFHGSTGNIRLNAPIVGSAATPDGQGYWEVASDGGVFTFGDATFFGSMGGKKLNQPVVGIAAAPGGDGYTLVAKDGGVFTFGSGSHFFGSMGGKKLNQPVVGIAATPDGAGYTEVASDGGVFTFGDATFFGSMGGKALKSPVVGIANAAAPGPGTPGLSGLGLGYYEVASDGGVFTFGPDAQFHGSEGATKLKAPMVGVAVDKTGGGYWEIAADGGVFTHGDAPFLGSTGNLRLNKPIIGMAALSATFAQPGGPAGPP